MAHINEKLYETQDFQNFVAVLHKVYEHSQEQHNNAIDYFSSLPTHDALYVMELCTDFLDYGMNYEY